MFNAALALNLLKITFWLTHLKSVETAIVWGVFYHPNTFYELLKTSTHILRSIQSIFYVKVWVNTNSHAGTIPYFHSSTSAKHLSIKCQQLDHWTVLLHTWSLAVFTSYSEIFLLPKTIKPASVKVNAGGGCACVFANPGLRCLAGMLRKQLLRFVSWFVHWPVLPAASYCANNLNLRHGLLLAERYPSCGERQD